MGQLCIQIYITRQERVEMSQNNIFHHYSHKQREFLAFVLDHYVNQGVGELDQDKLPDLLELKFHSIPDAAAEMGSVADIRNVFIGYLSASVISSVHSPARARRR